MMPIDAQARQDALDVRQSICVTAPAGSGKTELLSQRVLNLLAHVDKPEEILAITFTRKAASEMHQRIMAALRFADREAEPEEAHRKTTWQLARQALRRNEQCGWQLLHNPSRLKIQTIDSLCASLTRQMPVLANFGAQPSIQEDSQTSYASAVRSLLSRLETDSPIAEQLAVLLGHLDNDIYRAERLLTTMLERRDQWWMHVGYGQYGESVRKALENSLQRVIHDKLSHAHQHIKVYGGELMPLLAYAAANLKSAGSDSLLCRLGACDGLPAAVYKDINQWLAIADALLTSSDGWRKTVTVKNGFPTETLDGDKARAKAHKQQFLQLLVEMKERPGLLESLIDLRYLPSARYPEQQWQVLEAVAALLPVLAAELMVVFQQQGKVDYSQISMAAMLALGDGLNPTELALKLDHRLSHILIDEFQDTSTPQFELLKRLTEGWLEYNQDNPERPNTLFIVGDGMQSIYGFREANVGLFLEARYHGVNGLPLQDQPLQVNFRSSPVIVDWVNVTFDKAFPAEDNIARGAVRYAHSQAFKTDTDDCYVTSNGFYGDEADTAEADYIAEQVQQIRAAQPAESIAILVRSRGHLREIIPALSRAGLSWNAADIDPLLQYAPVMDLLSLTKSLCNLTDRVAWAALVRSPLCGLNNSDLHALLAGGQQRSVWWQILTAENNADLSKTAKTLLQRLQMVLQPLMEQRSRKSLRASVEGAWMALGGAASLAHRGEFEMVHDYFSLLSSHQVAGRLIAISDFEAAVNKLYASPQVENPDLEIMTIHKSKGLEFDTVILPALAKGSRSNDKPLLMWGEHLSDDGQAGLLLSPLGARGDEEDAIYQYLRYEKTQSEALENTRLLYVAATRAVKRLLLSFSTDFDAKKDQPKVPAKQSLAGQIWPALEQQVRWQEANPLQQTKEQFALGLEQQDGSALMRQSLTWQAPASRAVNPLQDYYPAADFDNESIEWASLDETPRLLGNTVHQALEHLALQGVEVWQSMDSHQRRQWLSALLSLQPLSSTQLHSLIDVAGRAIENTVNDAKGRWILSPHQQACSEMPILVTGQHGPRQFIIDRTFVTEGVRWIVDYKTGRPQADESRQAFIAREVSRYSEQLQHYKKLLAAKEGGEIRVALYFTHYPHWQEINVA
jgi:ATP-dependent exoDNAse (exonuclease V) beta subunit